MLGLVSACSSPADKAARANGTYEAAIARGDNWSARAAMLQAVRFQDDVPTYWLQLAKAQTALGQYGEAYEAYSRASELDRSNVEALQSLADIAMMSGRPREANQYSDQVLLLQPSNPAPITTKGFLALQRGDFDEAIRRADTVLALAPLDTSAKILKARALAAKGQTTAAVAILEAQSVAAGNNSALLATLLKIYLHVDDKQGIKRVQERKLALDPTNRSQMLDYAAALYQAADADAARQITFRLARTGSQGDELWQILSLWHRYESAQWGIGTVQTLLPTASTAARVRESQFLIDSGAPELAASVVRPLASLPVTAANIAAVSVLAASEGALGHTQVALDLLKAALKFDSQNVLALRTRADLYLRLGEGAQALWDSQRLVAGNPATAGDRLRLARAYELAGKLPLAEETYWNAIRDIPGDRRIYANIKLYLLRHGQSDSMKRVDQLYREQQAIEQAKW